MPVKTTCPYCGVGCGILVDQDSGGAVTVRGDPLHPANFGRLCAKGSALALICRNGTPLFSAAARLNDRKRVTGYQGVLGSAGEWSLRATNGR